MQTAHAIGGLGELLQQNGAVFELGLASVDSPDAPPMSPEQVTGGIISNTATLALPLSLPLALTRALALALTRCAALRCRST